MSQFVDGFVVQLNGKIPDDELRIVRDELQVYIDKWEAENNRQYLAVPDDIIPIEYKEWLVTMKLEGKSPETIKAYNGTMVPFFMTLQMRLQDITTQAVKVYLLSYAEVPHGKCHRKAGPHTLEIMRIEINSFFNWCVDNGKLPRNPAKAIRPIQFDKKPIDVLSAVEMSNIRYACRDDRERAIIEVLYSTGCRVGELCGMKKTDIEWENANRHGVVPVRVLGKGNRRRKVYLTAEANVALKRYLESRVDDCDSLFVTMRKRANPLAVRNIQIIVKEIGERAGIQNLHPHEFRHTRATNFARESGSVLLTSRMLGHAMIETTQKYYIAVDDTELEHEISRFY